MLRSLSRLAWVTSGLVLCGACLPPELAWKTSTVDGRTMAWALHGTGSPAVVFEAGFGDGLGVWSAVFPEVSRATQAFAWDRPGYGHSAAGPSPRDAEQATLDVRALLASIGVPPPYVLVGHSMGGLYQQYFARHFPDEVAAVVSLEGRPAGMTAECERLGLVCGPPADVVRGYRGVQQQEWDATIASEDEVLASDPLPPQLPFLVVLGRGKRPEPANVYEVFTQMSERMASTPRAEVVWVDDSGHYLHVDQPARVIEIVRGAIDTARH